jgi:plastocyanin
MNKLWSVIIVVVVVALGAGLVISKNNKSTDNQTTNTTQSSSSSSNTNKKSQTTGENEVAIINMSFSPASLTLKKGLAVKWINNDNVAHNVTENDGKSGPSSPTLQPGGTYSFTFNEAGVFHYHCSIHPDMTGVVTVTE